MDERIASGQFAPIYGECLSMCTAHNYLGINLSVPSHVLEEIRVDCNLLGPHSEVCLAAVLDYAVQKGCTLSNLIDALRSTGRPSIASKLQEVELSPIELTQFDVSQRDVLYMLREYHVQWFPIGILSGLPYSAVLAISMDNSRCKDRLLEVVRCLFRKGTVVSGLKHAARYMQLPQAVAELK